MGLGKYVTLLRTGVFDTAYTLTNLVAPSRKVGEVTPAGCPGAGGKWPEYIPPRDGDSRCSCPALNAMANHGLLARDGKGIGFQEMTEKIRATYNFSESFCVFVPKYAANMLGKDYATGTFDLVELDLHNGIEHDASLCREDSAINPDQSKPHVPFIRELLDSASGTDADGNRVLTIADLSAFSTKRRVEARETNPAFTLEKVHKTFGSSNASTMLTIFGGRVDDLEAMLLDERIPDGWESRILEPMGLTIIAFNLTVAKVEGGIDEEKFIADRAAAGGAAATAPSPAAP